MFFVIIVIFLLLYNPIFSDEDTQKSPVMDNFHRLFKAVAKNESKVINELKGVLKETQQVQKEKKELLFTKKRDGTSRVKKEVFTLFNCKLAEDDVRDMIKNIVNQKERETLLIQVAVNAEQENDRLKKELYENYRQTNFLWLIRVRSAIEFFEDQFYQGDFTNAEWVEIRKSRGHERSRLIRRLKFQWIFANNKNIVVQNLVTRIQKNQDVKTTDKFSNLIAIAYSDLSASIRSYIMFPGGWNKDIKLFTLYPQVNEVVELFSKTFEFGNYVVKPASFTTSPATSASTLTAISDSTPQPPAPATE